MSHAGFALAPQDHVEAFLVACISPQKIPPRFVIDVRETVVSGMHGNMMGWTAACLITASHRAGIASSEAKFCDTEGHGICRHR